MDANLTRWLTASVNKHVASSVAGVEIWYEGLARSALDSVQSWIEVRTSGALVDDQQGQYAVTTLISINVCVKEPMPDIYIVDRLMGKVQAALLLCIPVKNYGDNGALPLTVLGHLRLCRQLKAQKLGSVDTTSSHVQAVVGGVFEIEIPKERAT